MDSCSTCTALRLELLVYAVNANDYHKVLSLIPKVINSEGFKSLKTIIGGNLVKDFKACLTSGNENNMLILCQISELLNRREELHGCFLNYLFTLYPTEVFNSMDRLLWCKTQCEKYKNYFPESWNIVSAILSHFVPVFRSEVDKQPVDRKILVQIAKPLIKFENWSGLELRETLLSNSYKKLIHTIQPPTDDIDPEDFFIWIKFLVGDMRTILPLNVGSALTRPYIERYLVDYSRLSTHRSIRDLEYIIEMIGALGEFMHEAISAELFQKQLKEVQNTVIKELTGKVAKILSYAKFDGKIGHGRNSQYVDQLINLFETEPSGDMSNECRSRIMCSVVKGLITTLKANILAHKGKVNPELIYMDYNVIESKIIKSSVSSGAEEHPCMAEIMDFKGLVNLLLISTSPQTLFIEAFNAYSTDRGLFSTILKLRGMDSGAQKLMLEAYRGGSSLFPSIFS